MSRNGSGQYNLPAGNPVVSGTTITSTWANNTMNDIASALTGSLAADGQTPATGNLNMANNRIISVTDPVNAQDAATKAYADSLTGGTKAGVFTNVTDSALTSGRVTYASTGGLLVDSANLTFNGTTLTAAAITSTGVATMSAGTASAPAITTSGDTNTGIFFPAADTIAFTEGGVEAMRIDSSGNVGIGTSSPAKRLAVQNATDSTTVGTNAVMTVQAGSSVNSVAEIGFGYNGWSGTNPLCTIGYQITSNAGVGLGAITFATRNVTTDTAPTERMRIDSSGNVGIGVTPSAWSSSYKALQIVSSSIYNNNANDTFIGANYFFDGTNNKYINTDLASAYGLLDGQHIWYTAPSGTAGNNVSFTERMRITSDGVVLTTTRTGFSNNAGTISTEGYGAKAGFSGSFSGNLFNINWTGSAALWIDTTNIGNIQVSSDYRIKRNIQTQTAPALERVMQLRPVTYQPADYGTLFKASDEVKEGFIAHEVQEVIPSGADGEKDAENQIQSLRVDAILAVAVKAIQEQQAMIEELKQEVAKLKGI